MPTHIVCELERYDCIAVFTCDQLTSRVNMSISTSRPDLHGSSAYQYTGISMISYWFLWMFGFAVFKTPFLISATTFLSLYSGRWRREPCRRCLWHDNAGRVTYLTGNIATESWNRHAFKGAGIHRPVVCGKHQIHWQDERVDDNQINRLLLLFVFPASTSV